MMCLRSTRYLQLLSLMVLLWLGNFVNAQVLNGIVRSDDGETIPFASIYIKEITTGTTTNLQGEYSLPLKPGSYQISFQALGFARIEEVVVMSNADQVKNVVLNHHDYQIKEVRVFSGNEDPAYAIMRKSISMAPYFLRQIKHYESNVYLKGGFVMNKVPLLFRKQLKEGGVVEGESYVAESINEITFDSPNRFEHRQISKRSTIPDDGEDEVLGYLNYSFYDSDSELAISPLSRKAFSFYKFRYEGFFQQGEYFVNKIKVTPKKKSQKLFEGYIFIVDKLWNLHSVDLVNRQFFGDIRIKQVQEPVKGKAWLPVSHHFDVDVEKMGFELTANYGGSVKYDNVILDEDLPVPSSLKAAYAEIEKEQEIAEELKLVAQSKNQQKIEALLQQEDLNNRDMLKLSRLMEKENKSVEQAGKGLELESLDSTYKVIKDVVPADSIDWNKIRPIPLSKKEVESFGLRDSLTLALAGVEQDTIAEDRKKGLGMLGNVLAGKKYVFSDSTRLVTLRHYGLLNLKSFGFNTVDGWFVSQRFNFRYNFLNDKKSRLDIFPSFKYAFNRKNFNWNVDAVLHCDPIKHTVFSLSTGCWSKDFKGEMGISPFINSVSSLLAKENYMKLYQDDFIKGGIKTDVANGLEFYTSFKYQNIDRLINTTNYSLAYPNREYSLNNQIPGMVDLDAFSDRKSFHIESKLVYTPKYYYRIDNGKKKMIKSDYPTFALAYKKGLDNVFNSPSKYDLMELKVNQDLEWSFMYGLTYELGAGYYFNHSAMHYSNYTHFNTSEIPVSFKDWKSNFNLLNDYEHSTNKWYVEGHLCYSTPYLIVKNIPFLQDKLWVENVYLHHLSQPDFRNYNEVGYGISQIFLLMNVGVFAGFEELDYSSWGFRVSLSFQ